MDVPRETRDATKAVRIWKTVTQHRLSEPTLKSLISRALVVSVRDESGGHLLIPGLSPMLVSS